jgi:hypothetical protein
MGSTAWIGPWFALSWSGARENVAWHHASTSGGTNQAVVVKVLQPVEEPPQT